MSRIENIVAEKCKAIVEEKKPMISEIAIQTDLQSFQSKILNLRNDCQTPVPYWSPENASRGSY